MGCSGSQFGEESLLAVPSTPIHHEPAPEDKTPARKQLGNEASISCLIEDFIDKSHFAISCCTGGMRSKDQQAWATVV